MFGVEMPWQGDEVSSPVWAVLLAVWDVVGPWAHGAVDLLIAWLQLFGSDWGRALFSSTSARSRAAFAAISAGSGGPVSVLIRMRASIAVGTDRVVLSQRFQVCSPWPVYR